MASLVSGACDTVTTGDSHHVIYRFHLVGKSTLMTNLAGVYSEVADYEFIMIQIATYYVAVLLTSDITSEYLTLPLSLLLLHL